MVAHKTAEPEKKPSTIFDRLAAPFPPGNISWRIGSTNRDKTRGMALAYIDARDVMKRLDEVVGPQGWQCRYPWSDGKRVVCEIGVLIGDGLAGSRTEWLWKADGAGETDFEGEKGAMSDAFKRAAVRWGIGRYLYDLPAPWVEIEARGNSFSIKEDQYSKLEAALKGSATAEQPAEKKPDPVQGARELYARTHKSIATAATVAAVDKLLEETRLDREKAMTINADVKDAMERLHVQAMRRKDELRGEAP